MSFFFLTIPKVFAIGILKTNKYTRFLFISGFLLFVAIVQAMKMPLIHSVIAKNKGKRKVNATDKRWEQLQSGEG